MDFVRPSNICFVLLQVLVLVEGYCHNPLLDSAKLSATSTLSSDRAPHKARLNGLVAWAAGASDFSQYFVVDLGEKRNVTAIATQGRPYTSEFVQEYRIEYGDDGLDYAVVKTAQGNTQLFRGNKDGNSIQHNQFPIPIVAQWIRINPTRWRDRISMRVELYGCDYTAETMRFDGQGYVRKDLSMRPINSIRDWFRFRFRTTLADGILLYAHGTQGDYFALQLLVNKLLLNIDLGSKQITSTSVGSLLDDNLWHDVLIYRNRREIVFTVDRVTVKKTIRGDFRQLDLNTELFVGGVPNFYKSGLVVTRNFTGCMENLFLNYTNIIAETRENIDYVYTNVGAYFNCREESVVPITFPTLKSYVVLNSLEGVGNLNISMDFRTFNFDGLILYQKLANGYLKLFLEVGKLKLEVSAPEVAILLIDSFDQVFNDGSWHRLVFSVAKDSILVYVNGKPSVTKRILNIRTGTRYLVGGGVHSTPGFIGCMRYLAIDGNYVKPSEEHGVLMDSCKMIDRCNPNPCEHGGVCSQNAEEFICDCGNSGYGGAVCHSPIKPLSCEAFYLHNPTFRKEDILIDIDGSGKLPPFLVTCEVMPDGNATTTLRHRNEMSTLVNGFDKPGSFIQDIMYDGNFEQVTELVNRSRTCSQRIMYACFASRLFNTPLPETAPFQPFSWWVSRDNQRMDFWGGSLPGTRKCECGLRGSCVRNRNWCNCDAGLEEWQQDGGEIETKEYLPVRQLRFGDTGTPLDKKQGRYTLGPLICQGDYIFDNVVTFRLQDATINYPTFDMGHSGDIYFEFKTTAKNGVFIHSVGTTDYIKVSIVGGKEIQFGYFAGNSPLVATVTTAIQLNDNRWHSVRVERNRKEAEVVVDGSLPARIREPVGLSRAFQLTSDFVVGATVQYTDGYVGCMRALMLNGVPVDMIGRAEPGLYGVLPNCIGKCDSGPCLNNGTCWEQYSGYFCDCRYTAFKGTICADEIGVNMRSDYMIKYEFEGKYKSTTEEKIRVGFVTTDPKGLLMGLYGYTNEYLSLIMGNSGHLKLVFDFGFERQELIMEEQNFANGQNHDVWVYRKNGGRTVIIKVDNYKARDWSFPIDKSQDVQFDSLQYMYIGKNETMEKGSGFIGCISRIEFDDVYPLKLLFQEDRPPNIRPYPEEIREDYCGVEAVTYKPARSESRPEPDYDPGIMTNKGYTRADSAVLGGILAIIFLALIAMAILIGRYVSRHKGEYKTHEDKGARDAPDADTAIVQGQTGHNVTKKKEIFI